MEVMRNGWLYANLVYYSLLQLVKNEKHVSAFLQLRSATEGIVVTVDFSFSVLSKEHFTKVMNEWMNEWTNERMNEWTNERMNDGMYEWINQSINEMWELLILDVFTSGHCRFALDFLGHHIHYPMYTKITTKYWKCQVLHTKWKWNLQRSQETSKSKSCHAIAPFSF